ncbi:MAG: hypothetical protein H6739_20605 [Alphaproteobacteria bacterium]|nr:hypothetical protein [Alphaproteobacteria bacterium]
MTTLTEQLRAVEPRQVAAWLRTRGWTLVTPDPERVAVYEKPTGDEGPFVVELPLDPSFRDYTRRMGEVLQVLVAASGQPATWVLTELRASTFDVVRLRATGPGVGAGLVPVELGTRLFSLTRELLLAAACAAHETRPVYRTRKPAEAVEFLRRVKLAAPEAGSFIVTVHAPVPPVLQTTLADETEEPPFERRSTLMLARSASAAREAAQRAGLGEGADPFVNGTAQGISANLLEALSGFVDGQDATGLDLSFAWASSRPAPAGTPTALHLGSDLAPILQEGARVLRARAPRPDFELEGIVVRLDSEAPDAGGQVVVTGQIDGQPRKVKVPMGPEDYALALRAHEGQQFLRCEGELVRQGRRYHLERVRHVTLLDDDGDTAD